MTEKREQTNQLNYTQLCGLNHAQIRFLRTNFGINAEEFIKKQLIEKVKIPVLMLLCPAYPHNGKKFTYEKNQLLDDGISPMVSHFNKRFSKLVENLNQNNLAIELNPLICDIEHDIPGVIDNFCNGNVSFFFEQVEKSSQVTADFFNQEYPNIETKKGTFTSLIGDGLLKSQIELVGQYYKQNLIPSDFLLQAKKVAQMRAESMSKQYATTTLDEQYKMAIRHMTSYLAVSLALAEKFPEGCIVFNNNSPNLYYVKSANKLQNIFNLQNSNLPIFITT